MRRLPAVVLAALSVVPALTVVSGAAAPGARAASTPVAAERVPVATAVHQLSLAGVDPAELRAFAAASVPAGTRGAPGAVAAMATSRPAVLTARLATAGFQTLGVTWRPAVKKPDLLISVRTRSAGRWAAWASLDSDAGDDPTVAPAGKGVRDGTDPLWVGVADGVQVRVVVRSGTLPAELKVDLVDPGTSGQDAVTSPGAASGPAASGRAASGLGTSGLGTSGLAASRLGTSGPAVASTTEPAVFSRAQWGADERKVRYAPTYMPTIKAAVLHHTAGKNNYSSSQVPSIIRGDYAYHLSRGWSDIGYNALVDRFGRIWEGRAGGLDEAVMGAHAGGFNSDTFGVSMIGNYDVARPTAASITAVARVMAWKLDVNHRDPLGTARLTSAGGGTARYPAGRAVTLPTIMGHRNTGYTACPGRYLYPYLGSIRSKVRVLMKAALTNPSTPPATVLRGTVVSVRARALAAQSWRLDVTAFGGGRVARVSGSAGAGKVITAGWNGRLGDGSPARPGRYRLTLTSSSATGTARPVVKEVLVVPPAPAAEIPAVPSSGPGGYYPLTPTRLLDTRAAGRVGLGPAGRVDIPVLGVAGVPATGVTSVVLNLTASAASDDTTITAWPTGQRSTRPLTGVPAGLTRSVLVTTRVGAGGSVSVGNEKGVTELTADVVGYFAAGGAPVTAIGSTRLYDSRTDPAGKLVADRPRLIPLPATLGAIASTQVTAVVVDVSALSPAGAGTLTAVTPGASGTLPGLSYRAGESVDNLAVVPVSAGALSLRATGTPVDATLDVRAVILAAGAIPAPAGSFTAVKPVLLVDTRATGGAVRAGRPRRLVVTGKATGVPAGATAVVLDLTAIAPAATTWLQAYAGGATGGGGTALRVEKGDTRGNLVVVPIGPGGAIAVSNARGGVQVRVDVHGYLE